MSSTEDDISIADDLIHTKQTKRYFLDEAKAHEQITCFNCGKKGHVKSECKEEKSCYICGSNNHEPLHCNAGVSCFNCYRPGHIRNDCPRDRSSSYCKRCDLDGHSELECQDIWKVYKRSSENDYGKVQVYCFVCGEEGHCGDICDANGFRRDRPRTTKGFSPLATYDALRRIGYKGRLLANYSLNNDRNREQYDRVQRPSGGGAGSSGFIRRDQASSKAAPSVSYLAHATNMNNYNNGARRYPSNGDNNRGFKKRGRERR